MSLPNNNPAARLYEILVRFRDLGHADTSGATRAIWCRVFEIGEKDVGALFTHLVDIQNLVRDVRACVENSGEMSVPLHLKHYSRIESLVNQTNLDHAWQNMATAVEEGVLDALAFTADRLGRVAPEPTVSAEEIEAVTAALAQAQEQVRASLIDEEVRRAILTALDAVQYALARYRTAGIEAFRAAWVLVLGTFAAEEPAVTERVEAVLQTPEMGMVGLVFRQVRALAGQARRAAVGAQPVLDAAKNAGKILRMLSDGSQNP